MKTLLVSACLLGLPCRWHAKKIAPSKAVERFLENHPGVQVIPVSEVAAKDDFLSIKNVSRDDLLAAHRVPPQLMGIIPNNTGGFGDVEKAAKVFTRNELEPLMNRYRAS